MQNTDADRPPVPPERTTSKSSSKPSSSGLFSRSTTSPSKRVMSVTSKFAKESESPTKSHHNTPSSHTTSSPRRSTGRTSRNSVEPSPHTPSTTSRPTKPTMSSTVKSNVRATAAAVTDRLSRPKKPSSSSTLTRHPSNSSVASEASTPGTTSVRSSTRTRIRPSPTTTTSGSSPRSSITNSSPSSNPFVRGGSGRATMPASVLRTNKRMAAEARDSKDAPEPPQRTSSIRVSARLNLSRGKHSSDEDSTKGKDSDQESNKPSSTVTRSRRSGLSSSSFNTRDLHKPDSKVGRLMSKFSGKIKEDEEDHPSFNRSAKVRYSLRETSLQKPPSSHVRGSSAKDSDSDTEISSNRVKKSPSFLKKIIDKSSSRKSVLNRSEVVPASPHADRRARVSVLKATTKSSRC